MGDRISIQYKNKDEKSVAIFSHWDGLSFQKKAQEHYIKVVLPVHRKEGTMTPLSRMEVDTIAIDFIRYLVMSTKNPNEPFDANYYIGENENCGDNSDNGNWILDVNTGKWEQEW